MDFLQVFASQTPVWEIVVRGSVMYLALYALLRVVLKRETGATGMNDLLVVVLIADAAQNGMAGRYTTITDGLLLVAVIMAWSYVLSFAAYRWRWARRLIRPKPLRLVRDGQLLRHNLRRELVTEDELLSAARKQGIRDLSYLCDARMESDGQFSFITYSSDEASDRQRAASGATKQAF